LGCGKQKLLKRVSFWCKHIPKPFAAWHWFELVLLVNSKRFRMVNSKIFSTLLNKMQYFCSQLKSISLRGRTKCNAFVRNSKSFAALKKKFQNFRCAAA
jgi:hypothetical protein